MVYPLLWMLAILAILAILSGMHITIHQRVATCKRPRVSVWREGTTPFLFPGQDPGGEPVSENCCTLLPCIRSDSRLQGPGVCGCLDSEVQSQATRGRNESSTDMSSLSISTRDL